MDGPGCGGDVNGVVGLPLCLVLVGGKSPQCSERPWVVLAWVRRGEAEEREGDLWVSSLLWGARGTGLVVAGLWGA